MAETGRSLGEGRIEELSSVMARIPALAEARRRLSTLPPLEERALEAVRSIWPEAELRQLGSSLRDFLLAEEAESCHLTCPGVKNCKNKGFRPGAYCEPFGDGGRIYVVRWSKCGTRNAADSQAEAERALRSARLPERLRGCTFETYRTVGLAADILKAKGMALAALGDGNGLILSGGNGVGKTHLAAAMVNARAASGKPALFACVPDLLDDLREAVSSGKETSAMATLKKAPFLVLDDLGAERLTDWAAERLYLVVNHRYLHRLQTVATTNAKGAMDLVARLGDQGQRVVSRLGEMGTWCGITAEDYRFLPKGEAAPGPASSHFKGNGKHRDSDRQAVMADIPF